MQWRFIAGCLIVIGSQGLGIAYNRNLQCSIYHLEQQKRMLFYAIGEIGYLKKPVLELLVGMKRIVKEPYQSFLDGVTVGMEHNCSLAYVWQRELEKRIKSNCYPKEAMMYLGMFPNYFIYDGSQTQLESLKLFLKEVEEKQERLKEEKQKRGRVMYLLSSLMGIFLIILFL